MQGRSRVLHECDVLVLPTAEADLARAKKVAPRGSRSLLAVECKYYGTYLSLYLARGFHGLHTDLGLKHPFFVANINSPRIKRYLSYHNRRWGHGVVPQSAEEGYFIGAVREPSSTMWLSAGSLRHSGTDDAGSCIGRRVKSGRSWTTGRPAGDRQVGDMSVQVSRCFPMAKMALAFRGWRA